MSTLALAFCEISDVENLLKLLTLIFFGIIMCEYSNLSRS